MVSWDEYFMDIAKMVATRSKDPNTKVGAVLVGRDNRIISTGYNGFPSSMKDLNELWKKPTKYGYVIHAEMNAIISAKQDLTNCKIYCTHKPCPVCAKHIAACGITEVHYNIDYVDDSTVTTDSIFALNNIGLFEIGN